MTNQLIYERFSKFGSIVKVLIFEKGDVTKLFIEFYEIPSAQQVSPWLFRQRMPLMVPNFSEQSAKWISITPISATSTSKTKHRKARTSLNTKRLKTSIWVSSTISQNRFRESLANYLTTNISWTQPSISTGIARKQTTQRDCRSKSTW